jgi:hypothetical protein
MDCASQRAAIAFSAASALSQRDQKLGQEGCLIGDPTLRSNVAAALSDPPFMRRCNAALRRMPSIEIIFETQMLDAAAVAPHKLQGLYPDFDMPFDVGRNHHLIRRFGLHPLGHHWLIGHKKQRASRNVVGKTRSKDCCSLHVDCHASCATQLIPEAIAASPIGGRALMIMGRLPLVSGIP